ncbi:MAG: hypothetical protein FGM55_11430 [Rhodoferax sp.]|nr:hypothetical protein [Rhodoferax sp.]
MQTMLLGDSAQTVILTLQWSDGLLSACLSDGQGVGRIRHGPLTAEGLAAWKSEVAASCDPGAMARHLPANLAPLIDGIRIRPAPGPLHLQLDEALLPLPWERLLGAPTPAPLYRHLTGTGPLAAAPATTSNNRHLRVLLTQPAADAPDDPCSRHANALASLLAGLEHVSVRRFRIGPQTEEALWRAIGDADIVHCLDGCSEVLDLLARHAAALRIPGGDPLAIRNTRLLVAEAVETGTTTRVRSPMAESSWLRAAAQLGLDLLLAGDAQQIGLLTEASALYRLLDQGLTLDEALAGAASPDPETGLRVRYGAWAAQLAVQSGPSGTDGAVDAPLRQVTVLCYDLVESTHLLRTLGAERYSETLDRFHDSCAQVVRNWGGRAIKSHDNDGVMCYFGLPLAHDDAPAMALRAAQSLLEAVARLQLRVRIGVVTGSVVVKAGVPMGEAIRLAARLQALAVPGTVVVAASTQGIVHRRFRFEPFDRVPILKGFERPVAVYRLLSEQPFPDETPGDLVEPPWTGREREMTQLEQAWAEAVRGRLTTLCISGEAGIGKSRLVREFKRSHRSLGHEVIECRCSANQQDSAFRPVIDLLTRWFRLSVGDAPHEIDNKIDSGLRSFADRHRFIPGIELLLDPARASGNGPATLPEKMRQQVLDALLLWMQAQTARGPVCLIIEDHSWLDPSSQECLRRLMQTQQDLPLLILLTERSGATGEGRYGPSVPRLELTGLDAQDALALIRGIGREAGLTESAIDLIAQCTDGVPLYIEEATRTLMAHLDGADDGSNPDDRRLRDPSPWQAGGRVQDLLMARLDRLSTAKAVAQVGSAIGREFSQGLIQAVCAHESAPLQISGIQFQLETLMRAGILARTQTGSEARYHFRHALMRDAAYQSLWERDRRGCHRTIARVIAESFPALAAGQPEILAHHCAAGGMPGPAVQYGENAARLAIARSALQEAERHLETALGLINELAEDSERHRSELRLRLLQAGLGITRHGYGADDVGATYRRAKILCQQVDDPRSLLRVQLGLEGYLFMRGDFAGALAVAQEAQVLLRRQRDPVRQVQAEWAMANLVFHQGHLHEAVSRMDACLAAYAALPPVSGQSQDPAVMSLSYSALAQWTLGFPDDALARARKALALAHRLKHPFSLGEAQGMAAMLHVYRREPLETLEHAQQAIHVCESSGFKVWLAHARILRGWAVAQLGNPQAGLAEMIQGYAQWTQTGAVVTCASYLALQAEVQLLCRDPAGAEVLLVRALDIADRHGERYFEPELHRLLGEVQNHYGFDSKLSFKEKAEKHFLRSISVARTLKMRAFEARAQHSLDALNDRPAPVRQP